MNINFIYTIIQAHYELKVMTYNMTAEILNQNSLPMRDHNPALKAEIFISTREHSLPVINLMTGRTGKGEGCPNNCSYCDANGNDNQPYWLNHNEVGFRSMLTDWADQGGKIIEWCGEGEPTTFKWFDTILDVCKEKGIKLELFTALNGLTETRAKKLIDIGAIVKFKMDSRNPTTMGKILTKNSPSTNATSAGSTLLKNIDMLIEARNNSQNYQGQLIASIPMYQINKKDIIENLDWCCQKNVAPQISYMEEIGNAKITGIKPLTEKEARVINRWLKIKYQIEPKSILGDQCQAKSAPIVAGDNIFLGPFGMGCEYPLREHVGEKKLIGTHKGDFQEIERLVNEFRFSQENLGAIVGELIRIRDYQGIYAKTGTDKLLPGCGDDIEELYFLEYVANNFTSDEYFFKNFIKNWVLTDKHRKWTESEINDLINQVETYIIN